MKLYYNIQKLLQVVSIIRSRKERPQLKAKRNGVEVSSPALMLPRGHLSDIHLIQTTKLPTVLIDGFHDVWAPDSRRFAFVRFHKEA